MESRKDGSSLRSVEPATEPGHMKRARKLRTERRQLDLTVRMSSGGCREQLWETEVGVGMRVDTEDRTF